LELKERWGGKKVKWAEKGHKKIRTGTDVSGKEKHEGKGERKPLAQRTAEKRTSGDFWRSPEKKHIGEKGGGIDGRKGDSFNLLPKKANGTRQGRKELKGGRGDRKKEKRITVLAKSGLLS